MSGATTSILTVGGTYFNFVEIDVSRVHINDIAHALAHICRFTGHTNQFYSVAQHSVAVSRIVPPEHALAGLLHDAAEAFLGDVSKPLKRLLPDYQAIEKRVEAALFARFGLPAELPDCVKQADLVMLATEKRDLMPCINDEETQWFDLKGIKPLKKRVEPLPPARVRYLFQMRFYSLNKDRPGAKP